jgi:transcriptional regulator with XRE-family HTH domain
LNAGEQLKELRIRLGITTREVEEHSRRIGDAEGNEEFNISNAWLTQIENKQSTPSVYKLYSLGVIYRVKFTDLLLLYGVDLEKLSKYQLATPLGKTHLARLEIYDKDRPVSFPVRFDPGFEPAKTNLLSRMVEIWGEVPISLIQHLDIRHSQYGYIGLKDYTLYPLLRPGSFVQIDQHVNTVQSFPWRTEYDRPIYFVELRDAYACSWCELHGNQLTLIPHPLSPCGIRQFTYSTEAEIIGRVTAVAMRIVDSGDHAGETARLPKRS